MNRLKQLFLRRRLYNDLSDEIREHLEEKIEELVAHGIPRKKPPPRPAASLAMSRSLNATAAKPGAGLPSRAFSRTFASPLEYCARVLASLALSS